MKLRNKKTRETLDAFFDSYTVSGDVSVWYKDENAEGGYSQRARYKTLTELNAEWEDYTPKEPLIKDDKIRKVVRAWADINLVDKIIYGVVDDKSFCILLDAGINETSINFIGCIPTLEDEKEYTIAELCGEEKE